jgi:imidazole glycerol-phosphate synthase subunit HisH
MIAVIDMGVGNLQSVLQAFGRVGAPPLQVTTDSGDVTRADAVILPGVGAFGDGIAALRRHGLVDSIRRHAQLRKPLIGICLGMQLLAEESEEHGLHQGLGLVRGRVVRLKPTDGTCRVPNMGWCDVRGEKPGVLFNGLAAETFYFAHSYHLECADTADVAATLAYGAGRVTAAVERGNLFGVQFHPEKSQDAGFHVLAAFLNHVRRLREAA